MEIRTKLLLLSLTAPSAMNLLVVCWQIILTFTVRNIMIPQTRYFHVQINPFCHCWLVYISSQIVRNFLGIRTRDDDWCLDQDNMMYPSPPGDCTDLEGQSLCSLGLDAFIQSGAFTGSAFLYHSIASYQLYFKWMYFKNEKIFLLFGHFFYSSHKKPILNFSWTTFFSCRWLYMPESWFHYVCEGAPVRVWGRNSATDTDFSYHEGKRNLSLGSRGAS